MTWTAKIEIFKGRSPYLEEIEQLATKTASRATSTDRLLCFEYNEDKVLDLHAILEKVMNWKTFSLFINDHLVDRNMGRLMLNCLLYSAGYVPGGLVCRLCPDDTKCEKQTKSKLNDVIKNTRYRITLGGIEEQNDAA